MNTTTPKPNTQRPNATERLEQAIRSHLGRIKDIDHPTVQSAHRQLQRELKRVSLK